MNLKLVVVGLGISGLTVANGLLPYFRPEEIAIFDSSNRTGGKIFTGNDTFKGKSFRFELGAGRFCRDHRYLMELIRKLRLDGQLIENGKKVTYLKESLEAGKVVIRHLKSQAPSVFQAYQSALEKLELKGKDISLNNYTFKGLGEYLVNENCMSEKVYNWCEFAFPYKSEFSKMNASILFLNLGGQDKYSTFYSLKGGLSQIPKYLTKHLKKNGVRPHLEYRLIEANWNANNQLYHLKFTCPLGIKDYKTEKLVLAIPPGSIYPIHINTLPSSFASDINSFALYRIYAIYPKDPKTKQVWFSNMNRIVTNNGLRYIIPINPKIGLIMISYTDGIHAEEIDRLYPTDRLLKDYLSDMLLKLFPKKNIPEPTWLGKGYWPVGVHYYIPGCDPVRMQKKYLKPSTSPMWICGEAYSMYQGWIEGSLRNANKVVNQIKSEI